MRGIEPKNWPRPRGYANAVLAENGVLFIAGQIGWDESGKLQNGFVAQFRQALVNIRTLVEEAGGSLDRIARMTWFITDKQAYLAQQRELGAVWREIMGRNYPAMSVVEVRALIEDAALVEIEATAVLAPQAS